MSEADTVATQAQKDRFAKVLNRLGGSAGNGRLREALGWNEATYAAVKVALIGDGMLTPGRSHCFSTSGTGGVWPNPDQPLWRAQRHQANARLWNLPPAAIDPRWPPMGPMDSDDAAGNDLNRAVFGSS
jgi:hypothetical protein